MKEVILTSEQKDDLEARHDPVETNVFATELRPYYFAQKGGQRL